MANEIVSEIRLVLDQYRKDLKEAEKEGERSGKKAGDGLGKGVEDGLSASANKIKTMFVAAAGAIAGAFTLKESIKAASEQESAIKALNTAMQLSGTYSEQASQHIQSLASSLQKTTSVADETIVKGSALLVSLGHLSGDGLDRATKAALDLSSALGVDVDTAFNLVAKASTGNVSMLGRYGLKMKETGDQAKDFANALAVIEQRFGGSATAAANTFDGALAKTRNQFGEVLESIGNLIIKSPTVITILNTMAKGFENTADAIQKWAGNRDVMNEIGQSLVTFGNYVRDWFIAPLELAFNISNYVVKFLAQAFGGLTFIIAEVGKSINDWLISPLLTLLQNVLGPIVGLFDEQLAASITNFLASTNQAITETLNTTAEVQGAVLQQMEQNTLEASNNLFNFDVTMAADGFIAKTDEFLNTVRPIVQQKLTSVMQVQPSAWDHFSKGFMASVEGAKSMGQALEDLGKKTRSIVEVGMTNSFAAMGAAMQKGQNGLQALGSAFLGVLGDIAIQAGATFIAQGLAMTLALMPTGPALMIAGAALATAGGALKSAAGGSGGGAVAVAPSPPSPGGGGLAASASQSGFESQGVVAQNSLERSQVGTAVNVNIAGNVLDRKETGLMIADVMNEEFGSKGLTFATSGNA